MQLQQLTSRHHARAVRDKEAGQSRAISKGSIDGLLLVLTGVVRLEHRMAAMEISSLNKFSLIFSNLNFFGTAGHRRRPKGMGAEGWEPFPLDVSSHRFANPYRVNKDTSQINKSTLPLFRVTL